MTQLASTAESESVTALIELVIQRSGMVTLRERRPEVLEAARELAVEAECADLDDYLHKLSTAEGRSALDELIERMTIGETYFLRHPEVFGALEAEIFPSWLKAGDSIRVWSAACSIGCEPYSLVVAWKEFLAAQQVKGPELSILGTDINTQFLEQARAAIYSPWSFRNLSAAWTGKFCDSRQGKFQLKEPYREGVEFRRFNLLDPPSSIGLSDGSLDLIFCRNVMIYFDAPTIARLAQTFHRLLKPGGWLIPGASECNVELFAPFRAVNFAGAVFYKKEDNFMASPSPLRATTSWLSSPSSNPASLPAPLPWEPLVFPPLPKSVRSTPIHTTVVKPDAGRTDVVASILAGNYEDALKKLSNFLQLQKMNPDWHFLLGLVQEATDADAAAEASYRKCLYLSRDHLEAQVNLALLLMRLGRLDAANRAKRMALRSLENSEMSDELLTTNGPVSVERVRHLLNTDNLPPA